MLMKRWIRAAVVVPVSLAMLQLPANAVPPAEADDQTKGLYPAVTTVADYLGGLAGYGRLGQSLPLTSLVPGGSAGIDLDGTFADLKTRAGSPTSLSGLTSNLTYTRAETSSAPAVTSVATVVNPPDALSQVYGLKLDVTATRRVEAPLQVPVSTTPAVTLATGTGPGVPLDLTWHSVTEVYVDLATTGTWMKASPLLTLTSAVAPTPFADAPSKAQVGVASVSITPASTMTLTQTLTALVEDDGSEPGDGRLYLMEPTSAPGVLVPGELMLPYADNVTVTRNGTVAAVLGLTSALYKAGTDPGAQVSVSSASLTDAAYVPTVTTNTAYGALKAFTNVTGADLLGGLGQLVAALSGVQRHGSVDKPLPYMDGTLADTAPVATQIADFVLDHTLPDDPATTTVNEFGQADFATVDEMLTLLKSEVPALVDGDLAPSYDPTTAEKELTFRVHLLQAQPSVAVPLTVSPYKNSDGTSNPIGRPAIGSALRATGGTTPTLLTGLSNVTDPAATYVSNATAKAGYEVDVVVGVRLRDAVPCATPCDTNPSDGFEQVNDLPPFLRWFLRTGDDPAPEITVDSVVTSPLATSTTGRAGFAQITIVAPSTVELTKDADVTKPTLAVQIKPSGSGDAALLLQDLLKDLATAAPTLVAPTRSYGSKADLLVDVKNKVDGSGPSALPGPAHVVVEQADATAALTAADNKTSASDASAKILKALDYNLQSADALAGKYLNVLDTVMSTAESINSAIPTDILGKPLPTLGSTPASLFSAYATFKAKIQDVRNGAIPPSLQAMNEALQNAMGSEGATLTFSLKDFSDGEGLNVIPRLHVDKTKDFNIPLSIDTSTFDVASLASSGQLKASVKVRGDIAVPISLKDAEPNVRVLDSARLQVDLNVVNDPALQLSVNLAGIQGRLGPNGVIKGGFNVRATVAGAPTSFANLDVPIDQSLETPVALSSFLSKLHGEFLPSSGGQDCQAPAAANTGTPAPVHGAYLCAEFPVYVNNAPLVGQPEDADHSTFIKVAVDDPTAVPTVTFPTGLDASYLAAQLFSFGPIKDGLAKLSQLVSDGLDVVSLKGKLPLVGKSLQDAAQAAKGLDLVKAIDLQGMMDSGLAGVPSPKVSDLRTNVLDPIAQAVADTGVLRDTEAAYNGDADTVASKKDVRFDLDCSAADGLQACADTDDLTLVYGIQVQMVLGQGDNPGDAATASCPAGQKCSAMKDVDLGLPAISLKMTGGSQLKLDGAWELELGFGYDKSTGFYVLDNPLPKSGVEDSNDTLPELSVGLKAQLSSFAAKANLLFLELDVQDDNVLGSDKTANSNAGQVADDDPSNHASSVAINGKINIQKPGGSAGNDRIAGGEFENLLANLGTAFKTTVSGSVDIDLHLKASVDGLAKGLPAVSADLLVDWNPSWTSGGGAVDAGNLSVQFNNVGIDIGAILKNTIGGLFSDIYKYTKPLDPIREFLFSPIPVVSDLATTFGGDPVTFFDLLKVQNPDSATLQFLEDVNRLLDIVKAVGGLSVSGPEFTIGSFKVPGAAALGAPQIGASAEQLVTGAIVNAAAGVKPLEAIADKFVRGGVLDDLLEYAPSGIKDAINEAKDDASADFTFPLFENPTCVFSMLMGANCVIAQWTPDKLQAGFRVDLSFGPFFGVLYVTLAGYAEVQAFLTVGYDTKGLMALLNGGSLLSLFDGFFLGDLDPVTKVDRPELVVKGGISAGGKVSIVLAEAGVEGGLDATFNADLRDGGPTRDPKWIDGVIRIEEIGAAVKENILCLFDFSGYLEAFLRVYATLGVCPFCHTESYDLARVKLLDFSGLTKDCNPKPPKLMSLVDAATGTWRLNVGPNAGDRGTVTSETKESFVLTQRNDGSMAATAFGFTEEHTGVKKVIFDFAGDTDSLVVKGSQATGSSATESNYATPDGKAGNWTIPLDGTMGGDADQAVGGEGDDVINGGGGDDRIELRGGKDKADGEGGIDQIYGGNGVDELAGGDLGDTLDGGLGGDFLDGQGGDDRLLGGADTPQTSSSAFQADGDDEAYGGPGKDYFDLGNGSDKAWGDGTRASHNSDTDAAGDSGDADEINLGPGNDKAWGGTGGGGGCNAGQSDILRGADGNDELYGQGGPDCLYGDKDDDQLHGGPGVDRGDGGDGNDLVNGNAEGDVLLGGNGADTMHGGDGVDEVYGFTGDDDIAGGAGADKLRGEAGDDWIAGDAVTFTYPRPSPRVLTVSDDETTGDADDIEGGAGADRVRGMGGDDTIAGGTEGDDLAGNDGVDTITGGDGSDEIRGNKGNDKLYGGPANDLVVGDAGSDLVVGDGGDDRLIGGSATMDPSDDTGDFLYGGVGNDTALGDNGTITPEFAITPGPNGQAIGKAGSDVLTGDDGDDVLYGQDFNDYLYGGAGADRGFGGLGDDFVYGQGDADFLFGDQGKVTSTGMGVNPGGSPKLLAELIEPGAGGVDIISGGLADDHLYGGAANDIMSGGLGDDYLEGNEGADTADGLEASPSTATIALAIATSDDDDIIGGSSSTSDTRDIKPDVGETMLRGGPGGDVVAGDNANIVRTVSSADATKWEYDYAQLAAKRTVTLLDREKTVAQLLPVSGGDTIKTGLGNDIAFGEGGDDIIDGEDGNDVLVGNQGHEEIYGGDGQDDLVGGSMADAGVPSTGRPDIGDILDGGPNEDVLVGDNANVVRTITANAWAVDPLGAAYGNARVVTLYDLQRPAPKTDPVAGGDLLLGRGAHDSIFGQAEGDTAKGGLGDDVIYGGQGSDLVEGNDGEDDVVGGSYVADEPDGGDRVQGGGGADVLLGDNGIVDRAVVANPDRVTSQLGVTTPRYIRFLDIDGQSDTSGPDVVAAGEGTDVGYGQDKDDQVLGGTGQDQLEGMGGADIVLGDSTTSVIAPEAKDEIDARGGIYPLPSPLPQGESDEPDLSGSGGIADQDDILGGTAKAAALDAGDLLAGEGGADFLLGDNGQLVRTVVDGAFTTFDRYDGAIIRKATRFDVNAATTLSGPDVIFGGDGNDRGWGQDQNDRMYGGNGDDDLLGELGDDRIFGEADDDVLLGDRGGIVDLTETGSRTFFQSVTQVPKVEYEGFAEGTATRVVDLLHDVNGAEFVGSGNTDKMPFNGLEFGGNDRIRGGSGNDSIHAGFGDDLANGDSGGDSVFGGNGADVLWGGKGCDQQIDMPDTSPHCFVNGTFDPNPHNAAGETIPQVTDYLFGGKGATSGPSIAGDMGADVLDWRPRGSYAPETGCTNNPWPVDLKTAGKKTTSVTVDPCSWFLMTDIDDDNPNLPSTLANNQHHQGVDWQYGGWDRDILQGDVADNGPNEGDRLLDWNGTYNLYTHCNPAYGGFNDVRQHSPSWQDFLQKLVYGLGAGQSESDAMTGGTSAFVELALVYPGVDNAHGSGPAFPSTPGHFDNPNACAP